MSIDTTTINIPQRKSIDELSVNITFTDRQCYMIEKAIGYIIKKNAPNFLCSTMSSMDVRNKIFNSVWGSMRDMTRGYGRTNDFKMDIETAYTVIHAVRKYSSAHLDYDRSERMVATRVVNMFNKEIQDTIDRAEGAYLNQVMSIRNEADSAFSATEFNFVYEASNNDFRVHAKSSSENWYSIATAYINISPIIDESGEMYMEYVVNSSGWFSSDGDTYMTLAEAKIAAEDLVVKQVEERDERKLESIAIAQATVELMNRTTA